MHSAHDFYARKHPGASYYDFGALKPTLARYTGLVRIHMPSDKNREECHKKYDRPRLMVQLDTLTESHEHPGSFGGVATLGAEACLAVLSCVVPDVAQLTTTQN